MPDLCVGAGYVYAVAGILLCPLLLPEISSLFFSLSPSAYRFPAHYELQL